MLRNDYPDWKNGLAWPDWKWKEDLDNERELMEDSDRYYYEEYEGCIEKYYDDEYRWHLLGEIKALLEFRMERLNNGL